MLKQMLKPFARAFTCAVAFLPSSLHGFAVGVIGAFGMLVVERHRVIEIGQTSTIYYQITLLRLFYYIIIIIRLL